MNNEKIGCKIIMQGYFCLEFQIPAVHKALPKCILRTLALNAGSNPALSLSLSLGWKMTLQKVSCQERPNKPGQLTELADVSGMG